MKRLWTSAVAQTLVAVATVAAFVLALLLAPGFRAFTRQHGDWVFVVGILLVVALGLLVGSCRERLSEAERDVERLSREVPRNDTALFGRLVRELPPTDSAISRLKSGMFRPKVFRWGSLANLSAFVERWGDDVSAQFVDPDLEAAKVELLLSASEFIDQLAGSTYPVEGQCYETFADMRSELEPSMRHRKPEEFYRLERQIIDLGFDVVNAYERLMKTAHEKGLQSTPGE